MLPGPQFCASDQTELAQHTVSHGLNALVLSDLHPIVERSLSSNAALSVPLVVVFAAAGILSEPGSQLSCVDAAKGCLLYTSPSPRDGLLSRMPSSA